MDLLSHFPHTNPVPRILFVLIILLLLRVRTLFEPCIIPCKDFLIPYLEKW